MSKVKDSRRISTGALELRGVDPLVMLFRQTRVEAGLSHTAAAKELGCSVGLVSGLELGALGLSKGMRARLTLWLQAKGKL